MAKHRPELPAGWPTPPSSPVESLRHTLDVHAAEPDDWQVVTATSGVYGPGVRTGLTLGDLRAIAALLAHAA